MSSLYTSFVWAIRRMRPLPKLVLLALADDADSNGVCSVDFQIISRKTGLKREAVRYALAFLMDIAVLVRHRGKVDANGTAGMLIPDKVRIVFDPTVLRGGSHLDEIDEGVLGQEEIIDVVNGQRRQRRASSEKKGAS